MASLNRYAIGRMLNIARVVRRTQGACDYRWIQSTSPALFRTARMSFGTESKANLTEDPNAIPPSALTDNEKKLTSELEKLKEQVSTLSEKHKELDDKYKRSLAESDNMRKRLTKQIDDAKIFGIQSFCKDLLEVSDILVHASESVPKEELSKNVHLKNLFEGLNMTKSLLFQVYKRNGLEEVNPIDQHFNPNYHEALFQQEVPNKESNTVVVVSKVGYKLHERCIRPALVGVSK